MSGAKQTADALRNLTSEVKSMPPVLDAGTKSTEKMTVAKGRLREQFRELRHAVPELSSVFSALTHPLTAVVALFGVAAVAVRNSIAEVNEAAEATSGFSAWSRGAVQTARLAREGARDAAQFAEPLKDTATAAELQEIKDAEGTLDRTLYLDDAPAWTPVGIARGIQRRLATRTKEAAEDRIKAIDRQVEQAGIIRDQRDAR